MPVHLPYCGAPPDPGDLLGRFNLDPVLIAAIIALACLHLWRAKPGARAAAVAGWAVAACAVLSPLCALSVSLFSARIGQHMVLVLIAAPLIALALPRRGSGLSPVGTVGSSSALPGSAALWCATLAFFVLLWFWHMPVPYDATFTSSTVYWLMHLTLFGSAILLWRELLHHHARRTAAALLAGLVTSMQMGLLGAVLTLASRPLFVWHFTTTWAWGLSPLQDQQLGGVLMWVPGIALFLWATLRSLSRLRHMLDRSQLERPRQPA